MSKFKKEVEKALDKAVKEGRITKEETDNIRSRTKEEISDDDVYMVDLDGGVAFYGGPFPLVVDFGTMIMAGIDLEDNPIISFLTYKDDALHIVKWDIEDMEEVDFIRCPSSILNDAYSNWCKKENVFKHEWSEEVDGMTLEDRMETFMSWKEENKDTISPKYH